MGGSLSMLRSSLDFDALQSGSRSRGNALLVLRYRRNEREVTRYGISTGRRIGSAVVRNRVRRRLRTLLRVLDPRIGRGWDLLIVARPPSATASQAELGAALESLLRSAGVMEGAAAT
jgi:ribonuclease P protein component